MKLNQTVLSFSILVAEIIALNFRSYVYKLVIGSEGIGGFY